MYLPQESFLLRAPLLPERAMADARALSAHPLGASAVALASAGLAGAAASEGRQRALGRYARRAAFRTTPSGLLAGVCLGELGARARIATGRPVPHLAPTWARMAALARALLDDDAVRSRVRLRSAPSLTRAPGGVRWIAPGDPFGEMREADLDARLGRVLAAADRWTPWPALRQACRGRDPGVGSEDADDLLLLMIDDGLLHADLTPPLVGPPPAAWMGARLAALGRVPEAAGLARALGALAAGDLAGGWRELGALPGAGGALAPPAVHAVLTLRPRRRPSLPRAAIERAAALAPLLFAVQEALAPPATERLAQPALLDALDAATEIFGAGALDLGELAGGGYGVEAGADAMDDQEPAAPAPAPPARLLATLTDALLAAASAGRDQAALDAATLSAALGDAGPPPPPTCELFLAPGPAPPRAPPGTGWLLGLHGPAGASWGRFGAALGAPLAEALAALADAERAARPFEARVDVAFAPSAALADLCAHAPVRGRTLALSTWSAAASDDLTLSDLELCADLAAAAPLALRRRSDRMPLCPAPLSRVRSATAPAGVPRLLVGWSLQRQHAPWALALGPLADLERVPRLSIEGFVVSPASWRIPAAIGDGGAGRAALARWRRAAGLPRWVQVGQQDQLLPVDLHGPDAARDLRGQARAWEIWPPLGRTLDRDGRRIEAVVALVDRPDGDEAIELARAASAVAAAGRVPPPRAAPPLPGWRTFKLFGPAHQQDHLLATVVGPLVRAARRGREIRRWFFLRYVDGPGRRPHLRLRVQARTPRALSAFEARLGAALAPARADGAVTGLEIAEYQPERARFGASAGALEAVHALFESDSALACALIRAEEPSGDGPDRLTRLVESLDALARGLGLDLPARRALARARRGAEQALAGGESEATAGRDREFRARGRALRAALVPAVAQPRPGTAARALAAHEKRTARGAARLAPAARAGLAPALLHLACVRLWGLERDAELRAYTFWERTLEGLERSARARR